MTQEPFEREYREYSGQEYQGQSAEEYTNPYYYHPDQVARDSAPDPRHATSGPSLYPGYDDATMFHSYDVVPEERSQMQEQVQMPERAQYYDQQQQQEEKLREKRSRRGKLAGLGSGLAALLGWALKLKGLVFLLKFGTAGLSVLLTVWLYARVSTLPFAIGFVALIFVHEMGHATVMKGKRLPISGMIFIPFLAAAVIGQRAKNAKDEAEVGLAGPIAGALGASVCLLLAHWQPGFGLWPVLAYMGFFINLFNLLPILPLDGGRILGAIDRRVWVFGFIGLLLFQIWMWLNGNSSWWLLIIVLVAASQLWSHRNAPQTPEEQEFYIVPLHTRITLTVVYFSLAAVLFMGMNLAHALMPVLQ